MDETSLRDDLCDRALLAILALVEEDEGRDLDGLPPNEHPYELFRISGTKGVASLVKHWSTLESELNAIDNPAQRMIHRREMDKKREDIDAFWEVASGRGLDLLRREGARRIVRD